MEERDLTYRVTVDEYGALRWTYRLDLRRNLTLFWMMLKIVGGIGLGLAAFAFAVGDLGNLPAWGLALIFLGGCVALGLLIYGLMLLVYRGVMRLHYVMTEETVSQIYSAKEQKVTDTLAAVALVAGLATGNAGQALGTSTRLHNSAQDSVCYFSWVRRIIECRESDLILLKKALLKTQVFVPPEDYDLVLDYIRTRAGKAQ